MTPEIKAELHIVAQDVARFRVSKMTVYRLIHTGRLPHIRVLNTFRIPAEAVDQAMKEGL